MNQIPFNIPFTVPVEKFAESLKDTRKFSGDGPWTKKCNFWFEQKLASKVLMTTSCTHALEMMALLIDIAEGDEVILPSYTFVSTANAFALRGAKIVFVDIDPKTMNLDPHLAEKAITEKTKAIVVVHYAGVACDMEKFEILAKKHNIFLLEDAAQGMMSTHNGRQLGTIGHLGTYSFHETKNYHCGEGGLLIINDEKLFKKAEIMREKGTDRSSFLRGELDKYTWQAIGSSYLTSELNAAYLYPQLIDSEKINMKRLRIWSLYYEKLKILAEKKLIELPYLPSNCTHNAHLFYIKCKSFNERSNFISYMKNFGVQVVSHYIPLHSAPAGLKYGRFEGSDNFTTKESERLVRLPLFYDLSENEVFHITDLIFSFYSEMDT